MAVERLGSGAWFGVGVVLGVGLAGFGVLFPPSLGLPIAGALAAVGRRRRALAVLAGCLVGGVAVASQPEGPRLEGRVSLRGWVCAPPQGHQAQLAVSATASGIIGWQPGAGRVVLRFSEGEVPRLGSELIVRGRAEALAPTVLPGAPDVARNLHRGRIRTRVRVDSWSMVGGASPALAAPRGRHGGVLAALGRGQRAGVPKEVSDLLRATGTSHLLAISGFHVGLVAGLGILAVQLVLRLGVVVRPVGLPMGWAYGVGALLGVSYAWTAGAPVSAQRAALMVGVVCLGKALGRSLSVLDLLGVAAALVAVFDPTSVGSPAFQLSFGAVLGMVRLGGVALARPGGPWRLVLAPAGATLGATLGTLPAVAWWFQELAPSSLLANLVAVPWVAAIVVPTALVACWAPAPLAGLGADLGSVSVDVLLWMLEPLAWQPWTPAVGPVGALLGLVVLLVPHRVTFAGLGLGLMLSFGTHARSTVVTVLGTHGTAVLVEQEDMTWLVDGGSSGGALVKYLRRRGIRRLDVVAATSGRREHAAGLVRVLEELEVEELWIANYEGLGPVVAAADARGVVVRYRPSPRVHPPPRGFYPEEFVERGLVLHLAGGANGVLIPGDLGALGEREALGRLEPVDVLVVGDHGSSRASSAPWLTALRPRIAVIPSVGREPAPEVLARLEGSAVYRTDVDGTVEIRLDAEWAAVRTWRAGRGWSSTARFALGPSSSQASRWP